MKGILGPALIAAALAAPLLAADPAGASARGPAPIGVLAFGRPPPQPSRPGPSGTGARPVADMTALPPIGPCFWPPYPWAGPWLDGKFGECTAWCDICFPCRPLPWRCITHFARR